MAGRSAIRNVIQSPVNGSAIVGATLTITEHQPGASELGKGVGATIFKSEVGSEAAPTNTIASDSKGSFTQGSASGFAEYWLPIGRYDMKISGPELKSYIVVQDFLSAELLATLAEAVDRAVLNVVKYAENITAQIGELIEATGAITVTSPPAVASGAFGVLANGHTVKVKAASGKIYGYATSGVTEITLSGYQHVVFWSDGTNWYATSGPGEGEWLGLEAPSSKLTTPEEEPGFRVSGTRGELRGYYTTNVEVPGEGTYLFSLPAIARPKQNRYIAVPTGSGSPQTVKMVYIAVGDSGDVLLEGLGEGKLAVGTYIYLDGINWPL